MLVMNLYCHFSIFGFCGRDPPQIPSQQTNITMENHDFEWANRPLMIVDVPCSVARRCSFGKRWSGNQDIVQKMERCGSSSGKTSKKVTIHNCGEEGAEKLDGTV